jgi:hypothetical protein
MVRRRCVGSVVGIAGVSTQDIDMCHVTMYSSVYDKIIR